MAATENIIFFPDINVFLFALSLDFDPFTKSKGSVTTFENGNP